MWFIVVNSTFLDSYERICVTKSDRSMRCNIEIQHCKGKQREVIGNETDAMLGTSWQPKEKINVILKSHKQQQ